MTLKTEVPLCEGLLPQGEPRDWLTTAVLNSGTTPPPTQIIAARGRRQLLAIDRSPDSAWIAAVDQALLSKPDVQWVGGYGSAVLKRDGSPLLASFARMRFSNDHIWLRVWLRLPDQPPGLEEAQTYDGPRSDLPAWLRRLFPEPRGLEVRFVSAKWSDRTWLQRIGVRAPDAILPLAQGSALRDFALAAAHRLEARVVHTNQVGSATAGWLEEGVAIWWDEELEQARRIGRRLAAAGARAAGLFGLGEDDRDGGHLLGFAVEAPRAQRLLWIRRFTVTSGGAARWLDPTGIFREPAPVLSWYSS